MPISTILDRAGRRRFAFEFSRRIGGRRVRARKLLPAAWSRSQADAYDRQESARLYAIATGLERQRYTIDQAVARYLDERAVNLKDGHGIATELALISDYYIGRPIETLADVCAQYTHDHRSGERRLAPATIRNRLRYLTSACRWGWKHHKMAEHDPAAAVVMPAVSNERQVYIDRRQMLQLSRACNHWQARAAIRIAFYSGMRIGELRRAEVDGNEFVLHDTKNGEPRRIPIHPKIRCCIGYEWPAYETLRYHFRKACAAVGIHNLKVHDLRHSAASAMLNAGVPLYTVGAVLGHKSNASTRRYAHHSTASLRDAVGRIGKRAA